MSLDEEEYARRNAPCAISTAGRAGREICRGLKDYADQMKRAVTTLTEIQKDSKAALNALAEFQHLLATDEQGPSHMTPEELMERVQNYLGAIKSMSESAAFGNVKKEAGLEM